MVFDFDSRASAAEVKAGLSNGNVILILRLVLDTGSNRTRVEGGFQIQTTNGEVTSFGVRLPALFALGHMREEFVVLVHDVDSTDSIDGVIGLDFLREHELRINFARGEIELI